ncbi:MAG: septum formation initiator family protein [Lentisphaerae bacterium]|nr:septum formation initiator family protein [Lentisphaerota bacterium]
MNIWLTIYRVATIVFVAMVIVAIISLFLPKLRQNRELQRKLAVIEEENRSREDQVKQLREQQDQFLADPSYVERIAREELGKAREGETVFRFSERKTNVFRVRP